MSLARTMLVAALAAAGGCSSEPPADASPQAARATARAESGLDLVPLEIAGRGRVHRFEVEVARTDDEQSRGLMYRERLAPDRGMVFPFPSPRVASFWMKNTLIPLDIIFVRTDGTIARIAAETVPHSLDPVESGEPVAAVLELAGGRAAELGIAEGDRVSWPGGPAR